jgi:NADPH:quinone reductase-like Zn-dependent oxidoreductase
MARGANLARSLEAVVPGGHIWLIGLLEADHITAPILPLLGSRASIVGISIGDRADSRISYAWWTTRSSSR